jgi:hypothetical protein
VQIADLMEVACRYLKREARTVIFVRPQTDFPSLEDDDEDDEETDPITRRNVNPTAPSALPGESA